MNKKLIVTGLSVASFLVAGGVAHATQSKDATTGNTVVAKASTDKHGEGDCGDGTCSGSKKTDTTKDADGKCCDGKCGCDAKKDGKKDADGKCSKEMKKTDGEGKCGDKKD